MEQHALLARRNPAVTQREHVDQNRDGQGASNSASWRPTAQRIKNSKRAIAMPKQGEREILSASEAAALHFPLRCPLGERKLGRLGDAVCLRLAS